MKKILLLLLATLFAVGCLTGCGAKNATSSDPGGAAPAPSGTGSAADATPDQTPADEAPTDEEITDSIVGIWTWEDDEGNVLPYIFNEDGTGSAFILPMTYTVEDGIITLVIQGFDSEEVVSAWYTVSDDTLVLDTGEETAILHRSELPEE